MERNRDPTCQKNGYVVFLRNTVSEESVNLKNHEHNYKEVYKPCMDYICKVMHGFDNYEKVEVSDEFHSVSWNDGDNMILADIVKEDLGNQCIKNNNIRCKQSVKRTRVEKMCNVAIIFNILNHIEKKTTLKDIPFDFKSNLAD